MELPEKLRANTTYTVSLGRDLKSHRGNALSTPLHLTFSTGPYIDTAQILGVVLPAFNAKQAPKFSDLFVFAYDITEHNTDSVATDITKQNENLMSLSLIRCFPQRVVTSSQKFRRSMSKSEVNQPYGKTYATLYLHQAAHQRGRLPARALKDLIPTPNRKVCSR